MEATHDLRRRVLRSGAAAVAGIELAEDGLAGTFHLGARDDAGALLGVVTLVPQPTPLRPGARAWRMRALAVEPGLQGRGVGRALVDAAVDRLRALGADVVWADARDSALGFYGRLGWKVVGDGFVHPVLGIPHHVVALDLAERDAG